MKVFKVELDELVKVWQKVTVTVEAESKDDIMKALADNTFMNKYDFLDCEIDEIMWETVDHLDWDYENTTDKNIEE